MASNHSIRVPERQPEPAEAPASSRAPRQLPSTKKPRFSIKLKGIVPN